MRQVQVTETRLMSDGKALRPSHGADSQKKVKGAFGASMIYGATASRRSKELLQGGMLDGSVACARLRRRARRPRQGVVWAGRQVGREHGAAYKSLTDGPRQRLAPFLLEFGDGRRCGWL